MKKNRIAKNILLIGLGIVLAYLIFSGVSIWNYGSTDEKQPADVAIVLGAGASDTAVSPVFQARIDHGIWLYQNGYVDYLLLTGGVGEGNVHSDAWVAMQYAVSQGVPESAILIEESSTITQENIKFAKAIMDEHSLQSAILVSDPLHMKRAMTMASDYGLIAYSSPTPTSRYQTLKTQIPFLLREEFFYIGYHVYTLFFGLL